MAASERSPAIAGTAVIAWQQVDDLLHRIGALSKSRQPPSEFAAEVCQQVSQSLGVTDCSLWLRDAGGEWSLAGSTLSEAQHAARPGQNQTGQSSVLAHFALEAGRNGAVEIAFSSDGKTQREQLPSGVVEAIAELVGDYYRAQRSEQLHHDDRHWRLLNQRTAHIHGSLDPEITAFRIANEGRSWLGCDRLCVLTPTGGNPALAAMSGVDRVDRRAQLVRALETLTAALAATGEPMWFDSKSASLPPEIDGPLHDFLEHAPAKVLGVIPLVPPTSDDEKTTAAATGTSPQPAGWLVVESFEQPADTQPLIERVGWLVPQAATALHNARQHRRVPWAWCFDRWARVDRRRLRTRAALVAVGLLGAALALALIPAELKIEARGELQPRQRREVFAPADGVIAQVAVQHGQQVAQDETLLKLKQAELDLELARVQGGLATARKKLAATQAQQFESPRTRDSSPERTHQLTAEEEELKELIRGLESQRQILDSQMSVLTVTSPLAGKVLTWNVEPLLAARPVARGQHLMTVADDTGPWELDLAVPDDRMGHVLAAQQANEAPLKVTFVVATEPGREYVAQLNRVAQRAETDAEGRSTVDAVVELAAGTVVDPRPGAEAIAHIHCGQRALGYVWFHDLIDAVRSWLYY